MLLQFYYSLIYAPGQHRIRALQMEPPAKWREAEGGQAPAQPHMPGQNWPSAPVVSHAMVGAAAAPVRPARCPAQQEHTRRGGDSPAFKDLSET